MHALPPTGLFVAHIWSRSKSLRKPMTDVEIVLNMFFSFFFFSILLLDS